MQTQLEKQHTMIDVDYKHLTVEDENKLISEFPNQFSRDKPITLNGKVVYAGLIGGNKVCHHLVKTSSSGVRCVKCGAWYCA